MAEIDMRVFAERTGVTLSFPVGGTIFQRGEPGDCMYVVQSGLVEMRIGETVVEVCGPNEAIGFMSLIDESPRSSSAHVCEPTLVTVLDRRKFRFMIDEVPNFSLYIMGAMARRIRGMSKVI